MFCKLTVVIGAFRLKQVHKMDFNPQHVNMFFATDFNDPNKTSESCKRMFILLFGDVVFAHFKMRANMSHAFTPVDYFKKFSVAIEGLVMGLLKVQGTSMTGIFDTKGCPVEKSVATTEEGGRSLPSTSTNSGHDASTRDDTSVASSLVSKEPGEDTTEDLQNESDSPIQLDLDPGGSDPVVRGIVPTKPRKKAYKKPQMDSHKADHARYSQEAFERRELILMYCNKKKSNESNAAEVIDDVKQKQACMVHTWYLKAIERVSELRQVGNTKKKKRKSKQIIGGLVKKGNNDWLGNQKKQTYENLEREVVEV